MLSELLRRQQLRDRAFGTTAAAAGAAGDGLFIIGNVSEENKGREMQMQRNQLQLQITQIFKPQSLFQILISSQICTAV